jgi:hypothetical protein
MRRNRLLCTLLALGAIVGGTVGVLAAEKPGNKHPNNVETPCAQGCVCAPCSPSAADPAATEFVHELVAVLNETRSSDAFIATVLALHRAGVDGKLVVPAIIKNAERLKLFVDTNPDQGTAQQKTIMEAVLLMLKKGGKKVSTARARANCAPGDALGGCGGATAGAFIGAAAHAPVCGALVGGACSSGLPCNSNANTCPTSPVPTMPRIADLTDDQTMAPSNAPPR